jgi:hypothetical protein
MMDSPANPIGFRRWHAMTVCNPVLHGEVAVAGGFC